MRAYPQFFNTFIILWVHFYEQKNRFQPANAAALPPFPRKGSCRVGDFKRARSVPLEADGFFYAFSTGNNGQDLYQIRRSPDLVHWEYVGQAFPDPAALSPVLAQLRAVYGKPIENTTLWAPDVVPATGGGYWLYGCFTAEFGKNYSVLFLAHASQICGPYSVSQSLVVSGGHWGETPNAIDPQILYDERGRMFMTYGSFFGGIRLLELNPETGARKDGFSWEDYRAGKIAARQYYGERLLDADDAEGSVAAYCANVPVYPRV